MVIYTYDAEANKIHRHYYSDIANLEMFYHELDVIHIDGWFEALADLKDYYAI